MSVSDFRPKRAPQVSAKAKGSSVNERETYVPARDNPQLPRRPGSEVAYTLPSRIGNELVYPKGELK